MSTPTHHAHVVRRVAAAVSGLATAAAFAVTLHVSTPDPTVGIDAHEKFQIVTVIAQPSEPVATTVTETDKPHELATTRATPQILAPRTVLAAKP